MNKKHFLLLSFLMLCYTLFAQDVKKDFKTSSVSIFKNGTAFFVKSARVKTTAGTYRMTENIPPALFGTYWIVSPSGELNYLSSYVDTLKTSKKVLGNSIKEMIYLNLGKKVKLHIGKDQIVEGVVEEIEKPNQANNLAFTRHIVNLRMDGKWMCFLTNEIRRIEFFEKPNQEYSKENKSVKPVLQVDFSTNKNEQPLDMMYLSNGLNWTPMYLIELIGEERAKLTLRAEVVNNIEDIDNTNVNFVVGVPNFSYANKLSTLIDFAAAGFVYNRATTDFSNFSNVGATQTITYEVQANVPNNSGGSVGGLQGSSEEDLYFYSMKNMSLKKGGRGHYPVFTADISIAHIYECNLPQNNANKNYYKEEYLFSPNPNKVFHSIKVNNDTKYPFTTGPALVVKKQGETKPISQDRLNYTSINGNSFVKLTEAPDVRIKQAEKALSRVERSKKNSKGKFDYYYDLITVEGQVKIKNYKEKKIDLNVRRTILGDLQKSNVKWLKSERINTSGQLNKLTDVCWETSIKAGAEITITYTYKIYVAH